MCTILQYGEEKSGAFADDSVTRNVDAGNMVQEFQVTIVSSPYRL